MYFARTLMTFWRDVLVKLLKLFANLLTSFCELFKIEREREKAKSYFFFPVLNLYMYFIVCTQLIMCYVKEACKILA